MVSAHKYLRLISLDKISQLKFEAESIQQVMKKELNGSYEDFEIIKQTVQELQKDF